MHALAKRAGTSGSQILFAIVGYMACSSLMLVANKLAVHHLRAPSFILWLQLAGTAVVVKVASLVGLIDCDPLEITKMIPFIPVAIIFLMTIFTNMKTLQYANVETFIVFRASTPLMISICDYVFLGRELPNKQSTVALIGLLAGACLYTLTDKGFEVRGYTFVLLWYGIFCLDQLYLKHVVDTVKMRSNWGRVYYTNLLASIPLVFMGWGQGEYDAIISPWSSSIYAALLVSVALGVAMSYFAWLARSLVSATYFTVIGNSCKLLTVIINVTIWDKHASSFGLLCLFTCLAAAYFYTQAPLRSLSKPGLPK